MKVTLHKFFVCTTLTLGLVLCSPHHILAQKSHGVKTIVIDPGHGGQDAGCVWGNVYEKNIVLSVGLLLGEMINSKLPDVKVVYTRNKDVFIGLAERSALANKVGADLFVSIHVNSVALKKGSVVPSGTETFVMGADYADKNLDVAMRENDVIVYEDNYQEKYMGYQPGSPESFVIFSLMQYVNTDQSINLAQTIQKQYIKAGLSPDRGVKQRGLLVLWRTAMPSILTEIGFIVNEKERRAMTSKDGQKKIATSLFNAISEYKARVEGNSNPVVIDSDTYESASSAIGSDDGFAVTETSSATRTAATYPAQTAQSQQVDITTSDKWTFGGDSKTETATASKASSKIVYRVQICSAPKKLSLEGNELRPFRGRITERKVGGSYKYYVGNATTYDAASELQKDVRKRVKDAFLVAFDGERQITVSEARKLTR